MERDGDGHGVTVCTFVRFERQALVSVFFVVAGGTSTIMEFQKIAQRGLLVGLMVMIDQQCDLGKVMEVRQASCSHDEGESDRHDPVHGRQR